MYATAPYWFALLLVVSFLGFWPSYFSPSAPKASMGQHMHALTMMVWVLLLIIQPWLIRTGRRGIHKIIGRFSLLWAALVFFTALVVVHLNLGRFEQPFPPIALSFFWLGVASAFIYAGFYVLAIQHRKNMQLHARYMAATALPFIVAGLGRLFAQLGGATGLSFLSFEVALWVPVGVGLVMVAHEFRSGKVRTPWVAGTVAWFITVLGFFYLPRFSWLGSVADWYFSL